jgi:hypothetical protein
MATYYWVGGTGTWDSSTTTNWATTSGGSGGAGVPGSADTVIFDAKSGSNFVVTTSGSLSVTSVSLSNPSTGTGTLSLGGSLTISSTYNQQSGVLRFNTYSLTCSTFTAAGTSTLDFGTGGSVYCTIATGSDIFPLSLTQTNITYVGAPNFYLSGAPTSGYRNCQIFDAPLSGTAPNIYVTAGGASTYVTIGSNNTAKGGVINKIDATGYSGGIMLATTHVSSYTAMTATYPLVITGDIVAPATLAAFSNYAVSDAVVISPTSTSNVTIASASVLNYEIRLSPASGKTVNFAYSGPSSTPYAITGSGVVNITAASSCIISQSGSVVNVSTPLSTTAAYSMSGGTYNLSANLTTSSTFTQTGGTFNVTATAGLLGTGSYSMSGGTFNLGASLNNTISFTQSAGTFNVNTGAALTGTGAFTLSSTSAMVFSANLTMAGTLTLTAGSITLNNYALSVYSFQSNNTNTRMIDFA